MRGERSFWSLVFASGGRLNSELNGFLLEPETEHVVDATSDFVASHGKIIERLGGFVDEDEGCFFADADAVEKLTFETGLFDEPSGVDFVAFSLR